MRWGAGLHLHLLTLLLKATLSAVDAVDVADGVRVKLVVAVVQRTPR